jgi:hypothetical protein
VKLADRVMAGHSRLKDGVASARLRPAIHVLLASYLTKTVDARVKPGHDELTSVSSSFARSEATKQSTFPLAALWIASRSPSSGGASRRPVGSQ